MTQNFRTICKAFVICRECREVSATRRTYAHYPFSSFDVIGRIASHPSNDDLARETLTSLNSGCGDDDDDGDDDVNIHPSEKRALLSLSVAKHSPEVKRSASVSVPKNVVRRFGFWMKHLRSTHALGGGSFIFVLTARPAVQRRCEYRVPSASTNLTWQE